MSAAPSQGWRRLRALLAGLDDGAILRFAFFGLLGGTLSVLYTDYSELSQAEASRAARAPMAPGAILPPAGRDGGSGPAPAITSPPDRLGAPLSIELGPRGVLHLTGSIDPGAGSRFAKEIAARGEYVHTVLLDSPGGSVMDALEIGTLIYEKQLTTKVAAGQLCASSCPIIFASGATRIASPDAAIGLHQVYAVSEPGQADSAQSVGAAMSEAQSISAQITRHLSRSGVDPDLWLHALETPPDHLYYLSAKEMQQFKLVTRFTEN